MKRFSSNHDNAFFFAKRIEMVLDFKCWWWETYFQCQYFLTNLNLTIFRGIKRRIHSGQSRLRRAELLSGHRKPPHRSAGQAVIDLHLRDTAKGAILYPLPSRPNSERSKMFLVRLHPRGFKEQPQDLPPRPEHRLPLGAPRRGPG